MDMHKLLQGMGEEMKLEVGKCYIDKFADKHGPMKYAEAPYLGDLLTDGINVWYPDGHYLHNEEHEIDLIAEWTDTPEVGPIRTVTTARQEIVPGVYGKVAVSGGREGEVGISISISKNSFVHMTADELSTTISTLQTIRDAMQANTTA